MSRPLVVSHRRCPGPDLFVAFLLLAGACDDVHRFENEGLICATAVRNGSGVPPHLPPEMFQADQPLHFVLWIPECLNDCSRDAEASCHAEVKGALIEVSSHGSFRQHGSTCTKDCRGLEARCDSGP